MNRRGSLPHAGRRLGFALAMVLVAASTPAFAQSQNLNLVGQLDQHPQYNDIWGYVDEFGVEHLVKVPLSGEAWERGPVVLSWDDSMDGAWLDGSNVVIHEFVHKLDMLNGVANGFPPMHKDISATSWSNVFTSAYEDFQQNPKPGLDRYGATAPAEFLAVMSEVFFEKPGLLDESYPEVYKALSLFFRQDPFTDIK